MLAHVNSMPHERHWKGSRFSILLFYFITGNRQQKLGVIKFRHIEANKMIYGNPVRCMLLIQWLYVVLPSPWKLFPECPHIHLCLCIGISDLWHSRLVLKKLLEEYVVTNNADICVTKEYLEHVKPDSPA